MGSCFIQIELQQPKSKFSESWPEDSFFSFETISFRPNRSGFSSSISSNFTTTISSLIIGRQFVVFSNKYSCLIGSMNLWLFTSLFASEFLLWCLFKWLSKASLCEKFLMQSGHSNGLGPLWVFRWIVNRLDPPKDFRQKPQSYSLRFFTFWNWNRSHV